MKSILWIAMFGLLIISLECLADSKQCKDNANMVEAIAQIRDEGTPSWDALAGLLRLGVSPRLAGQTVEWVYNREPDALPVEFKETILKECRVLERREKARKH